MRELLAIEVGTSIDPAFRIQERPHLPRPDAVFLSEVCGIRPIGDDGRVGGRTGEVAPSGAPNHSATSTAAATIP
jgi:hypothetical protein